jgi:8-oxo-dGTP diphosphatase
MAAPNSYKFCPQCGLRLKQRLFEGRKRPYCPACDRMFFQDPKVATAVLIEQDGKILLVKRANVPERGKWTLPAGFVDAGEDPKVAAIRECKEETGFTVRLEGLLDVLHGKEHERGADIVIVYIGKLEGGEACAGDDALEVAFFSPDRLPPIAFQATRKALELWWSLKEANAR